MKTQNLIKIIRAEKALKAAIELLKSEDYWPEDELLLFTDLRQSCNLFDFEMEEKASQLKTYNT